MGQSCSQNCSHLEALGLGGGGAGCGGPGGGADGSEAQPPRPLAAPLRHHRRCEEAAEDDCMPLHATAFQISVAHSDERPAPPVRAGWRSAYALGKLLGDGISAKVYEAEALTSDGLSGGAVAGVLREPSSLIAATCSGVTVPRCFRERGRRVAIKRFHRVGSRTFQKELWALRAVGVHPHVLRLLESYQGHGGEDVLVLEYCDGATLYDLYAQEHPNGGLPERLIARFVRQLLLALEHLANCGVEHQDVKPENMMLYDVSVAAAQGELKLGDFGWAAVVAPPASAAGGGSPSLAAALSKTPATGAGSLWYAPPELNPPVPGVSPEGGIPPAVDARGELLRGRSDMWSVGVVLYLLLVGHNPFNTALKQPTPEAVDAEVLRLVALGKFNRNAERWKQLHVDASDFISVMLRVKPAARPSASEALRHPFLLRRTTKSIESSSVFFTGALSVSMSADRERAWAGLDGLQRLGWVAVARAVAEPELDRGAIAGAFEGLLQGGCGGLGVGGSAEVAYLWQLARELATTPVLQWLQERGAWADVVRLAFCYLDLDADGLLSPQDLAGHLAPSTVPATRQPRQPLHDRQEDVCLQEHDAIPSNGETSRRAWATCSRWVARWQDPDSPPALTARGCPGLPINSFREALLATSSYDNALFGGAFDAPLSNRGAQPCGDVSPGAAGHGDDSPGACPGVGMGADGTTWTRRRKLTGHDEEEISWKDMVATSPRA